MRAVGLGLSLHCCVPVAWPSLLTYLCLLVCCARCNINCPGGWNAPDNPLIAVPLNMTAGYSMWQNMDAALKWTKEWSKGKPILS